MEYFSKIRQISLRATFVAFSLALPAVFWGRWPAAFGVLVGCLTALINLFLLSRTLVRQLQRPARTVRMGMTINCLFRYIIMIGVVLAANANPNLNVWAVFVGLILIKAVILGEALFIFAKRSFLGFLHSAGLEGGDK